MKVAVICNTDSLALPAINYLNQKGCLAGVGVLNRYKKQIQPVLSSLGVTDKAISFFQKESWVEAKTSWLRRINADVVWVFAFPWKIPVSLLSVPPKGFYNFHFGSFPKYKGADPIFWQIKNAEQDAGFVIHKMTEDIDGGPILYQEKSPVFPGENYGLYSQRMSLRVAEILDELMRITPESASVQQNDDTPLFFHKPAFSEKTINWKSQGADAIESLVNACNPRYGGASTRLRGLDVKILEVSPADVHDAPVAEPGTIIYADALYGLIVACKDHKFLRLLVLSMREGYLSGTKLFSMGVKTGEKFYD